jgi:hypothetical protein
MELTSSRKMVPPWASSKRPILSWTAPVKAPFFVAEEFGLEEVLGEGGAVDGDEGLVLAGGVEVEGAGDEFLAGAAFALDEDGGVGVAANPGHHDVEQSHVMPIAQQSLERTVAVERFLDAIAGRFQPMMQDKADARIVVSDQYGGAGDLRYGFGERLIIGIGLHRILI